MLFIGVLKARILKWLAIPFSSGPHSVIPLHYDPSILGDPGILVNMAWFSFIELDKAVVCVFSLTSFMLLWFQCVCPLMLSHNTYCLTWVSLTLDVGYQEQYCIGTWNVRSTNQGKLEGVKQERQQ